MVLQAVRSKSFASQLATIQCVILISLSDGRLAGDSSFPRYSLHRFAAHPI